MKKTAFLPALAGLCLTISAGCAKPAGPPESAAPQATAKQPQPGEAMFDPLGSNDPLPADRVFFPQAYLENDAVNFRIQILPGYYVYRDKIGLRSLSQHVSVESISIGNELSPSEIVVDEWFGEQDVFFIEAAGVAYLRFADPNTAQVEIELTYQGCKTDEICYLPVAKVISLDVAAADESDTAQTEVH